MMEEDRKNKEKWRRENTKKIPDSLEHCSINLVALFKTDIDVINERINKEIINRKYKIVTRCIFP